MNTQKSIETLFRVYTHPAYSFGAFTIAGIVLLFAVWLPNLPLLTFTITQSTIGFYDHIVLVLNGIYFLETSFTTMGSILLVLSSVLTGISLTLVVYYVKEKMISARAASSGMIGLFVSLFGIGCTSCGTFLLSTFFGLTVGTTLSAFLPLHGVEFSVLGMVLLCWSIVYTLQKIEQPRVCKQ